MPGPPPALAAGGELVHAVLETIDVGIVACDAAGHLVLFNEAARRFHGGPSDPSVPVERWASRFDLYRPDGVTPLPTAELPLLRALTEGTVRDVELVIAPVGLPAVTVRCSGAHCATPTAP